MSEENNIGVPSSDGHQGNVSQPEETQNFTRPIDSAQGGGSLGAPTEPLPANPYTTDAQGRATYVHRATSMRDGTQVSSGTYAQHPYVYGVYGDPTLPQGNSPYGNTAAHNDAGTQHGNPYGHAAADPAPSAPQPPYGNVSSPGDSFGGGNGGYGQGPFLYPGYGNGFPAPIHGKKPRYRWSTAFLSVTAALALLVGGITGAGITTLALDHNNNSTEGNAQTLPQQQLPNSGSGNGNLGDGTWGNGGSGDSGNGTQPGGSTQGQSDLEQGTKVNSAPGLVVINSSLLNGTSAGTGFVIDAQNGILLTNYHVVADTETVLVTVADSGTQYEATVLGHDATQDIAVLQIKDAKLDEVTIAKNEPKVGDAITMLGNADGQGYISALKGNVTAVDQTITARDSSSASGGEVLNGLIETDADVVPGYSGGVMVNSDGEVVGITVAASGGTTSATVNGYAIPVGTGMKIAKQVLTGESSGTVIVGRNAALGIQVQDASAVGAATTGASVSNVIKGSAAEAAGVQAGDIITAVDGKSISSASDLTDIIHGHSVGDTVELSIVRGTQTMSISVTLKESSFN